VILTFLLTIGVILQHAGHLIVPIDIGKESPDTIVQA